MSRRSVPVGILAWLVASAPFANAQVVAFDIGSPDSTYVRCQSDGMSWEMYPPYAFGSYPPGTIVYASIVKESCDQSPQPGSTCFGSFVCYFNDGGCGCGGRLVKATALELHYDPAAVAGAHVTESSLRLVELGNIGPGWTEVPGASVDLASHALRAEATGTIIGNRYYAIVGTPPTAVESGTWGGVKALWR